MKKKDIRIIVLFGSLLLSLFVYLLIINNKFDRMSREYPDLTYSDSVYGRIDGIRKIDFGKKAPGKAYISISGRQFNIITNIFDIKEELHFDNAIEIGDSISKNQNSITLELYDGRTGIFKKQYTLVEE